MPCFKPLVIFASILIALNPLFLSATSQNDLKNKANASRTTPAAKASKTSKTVGPAYAQRDDVMRAVADMAQRRNLDTDWVRQAVGQAHYMPQVVKFIQPPPVGTAKNWRVYRSRFIDPVRIKAGVAFWQANREALERAEKTTGVPAEIIAGVIGVETIYGQQMGTFRVLDALTTLAFDFPANHPRASARSEFFKGELEQYLSLTHRTGVDPLSMRGSFAGAMGMPQFMPSSWVKYAIDFDGDGRIDLFNSAADVIGSVANYFVAFNWQSGMPTHYPVSFEARTLNMEALMAPDILPTFSVPSFVAKGAVLEGAALQHKGPLALIELQNGESAPSYVAGTENFYAITRYNWSSYYAMAVIELGQEIARAQANTTPSNIGCSASSQAATSSSLTCK
jgi:membrane-bound lytic murein transglycosylase B